MGQNDIFSKIIHFLFYWNDDNHYIFSRSKFITVVTVIVLFINYLQYFGAIRSFLTSIFLSIPIFIIGFLIHKFMNIDSSFYNDNLSDNIKHFLFYWYDGVNKFKFSKTKLITIVLIIISLILGQRYDYNHNIITGAPYGLIFALLAFLIGYVIHISKSKDNHQQIVLNSDDEIANNELNNVKKSETNLKTDESNVPPKFDNQLLKVEELKREFDNKELKTKKLINAKFDSSPEAYNRFMAVVDNCSKLFNEQYNAVFTIINFADNDSTKVEGEINSKIDILQSFTDKLDELSNELVINMSKSNTDDVDDALNDIEELISSINDYEN